jgi:predicted PurR-regulated permease PerM
VVGTAQRTEPTSRDREPWEDRWPPVSYWVKVALAVAAALGTVWLLTSVADVVLVLLIALVLAAGLDPAATRLERAGLGRTQAVAVLFGIGLAFVVGFVLLVTPAVAGQLEGLSEDIPRYVASAEAQDGWFGDYLTRTDAVEKVQSFIQNLPKRIGDSFGTVLGVAGKVGAALLEIVAVIVLTGYLLSAFPRIRRTAPIVAPVSARERAEVVVERAVERVGAYVAGNAVTSLVCGVTTIVALFLLGVPFAVPLGFWAGVADLIPILGPFLGAIPAVVVAFFVSPLVGVLTLVFFIVYQQVENYVLVPRVMRDAVHLSPAATILSSLIGAGIAGFAGALLALPVAAILKVVIVESWLRDRVDDGDPLAREQLRHVRREERDVERARAHRRRWRRRVVAGMQIGDGEDA